MVSFQTGKSVGNKVVMAKIAREDFIALQNHCAVKNETINAVIRKAILNEITEPLPHMLAGKNSFIYNRDKDNFSWSVMLDNGLRIDMEDNLSFAFMAQLQNTAARVIDERNTYVRKEMNDSVTVPSKIVRKGM